MTRSQEYWASLPESVKDERRARMREYANGRYKRMKATGIIKLKGRKGSIYGQNGAQFYIQNHIIARKIALAQCSDCGLPCEEWNHVMFAFDHLDPSTKSFAISKARGMGVNLQLLNEEINKCELVCHNCHAFRTWVFRHHDLNKVAELELPLLALMANQ